MRFLDQAKIWVKAGDGGAGCVSFRREKYIEFGGPDGGNGGRGGDVVARCMPHLGTLVRFRYKQHYKAKVGVHGMGKNRTGAAGETIYLDVPEGTQIFDDETEALLADLTTTGQEVVLKRGGNGGFGNQHFRTSVTQAPRRFNPGLPGEEGWLRLQLKVIADIGLLGLPNAGKSTFLSTISAATPKIADYPFTTLYPELGVIEHGDDAFVVADVPGLIEGAHEGHGLGHRFLGHVERCTRLLHLVDISAEDPLTDLDTVRQEVALYADALAEKPVTYALTKMDCLPKEEAEARRSDLEKALGQEVFLISSHSGEGIKKLVYFLGDTVTQAKLAEMEAAEPAKVWSPIS